MKSRLSVPLIVFPVYELLTKAFLKKKKYCHKAFQSKLSLYQHLHLC